MTKLQQLAKCEAATVVAVVASSTVYSGASWIDQSLDRGIPAGYQIALLFFALPLTFGLPPAVLIFAPLYFLVSTRWRMTFLTASVIAVTIALLYESAMRRYWGVPLALEAAMGSLMTALLTHAQIKWSAHWYRLSAS